MHYLKLKCHRVCWLRLLVDLTFSKIHAELSIFRLSNIWLLMRLQGLVDQTQFAGWLLGSFMGESKRISAWQAPASGPAGTASVVCSFCLGGTPWGRLLISSYLELLRTCASYIITDLSPGVAGLCSAALCVAAGLLFEGSPWPFFPPALQHRSWGLIV